MHRVRVRIVEDALDANNTIAKANRDDFDRHGVTVVTLTGAPGAGKTALLEHAAETATGFRVLRATGIESEAELPYATLHQLLRPLEDRIEGLAEPQARALRGALGLSDERDADRFLVGAGTLTLLADSAEEQPILVLLDDAAWFDRESGLALGFVVRRRRRGNSLKA